jgi:hypothetical protein
MANVYTQKKKKIPENLSEDRELWRLRLWNMQKYTMENILDDCVYTIF